MQQRTYVGGLCCPMADGTSADCCDATAAPTPAPSNKAMWAPIVFAIRGEKVERRPVVWGVCGVGVCVCVCGVCVCV